jgi:hypothetical protein
VADYPTRPFEVAHPERDEGARRVRLRRITYTVTSLLLSALVLSAVLDSATEVDLWGASADEVTSAGGGYVLEVRYPTVSRPALATPFDIVVRRAGGFDGPVDIAIDSDWFEMWDYQALQPEPSESTGQPDRVIWTFEPPDGDVLRIFLDARIQPAQQSGTGGWVAILDESGEVATRVDFNTRVLP